MNLIDTHCHLDTLENPEEKYKKASEDKVTSLIIPSVNANSIPTLQSLSNRLSGAYYAVGIFPTESHMLSQEALTKQIMTVEATISTRPEKLVAIGECGLDFSFPDVEPHHDVGAHSFDQAQDKHEPPLPELKQKQVNLFQKHIDWALTYNAALIIHNRKANQEILDMVSGYPELTGVFHCFCQRKSFAKQILEQTNFFLGLGGLITTDFGLAETVKTIPLERIILETDSPYLVPKEAKAEYQSNEPSLMVYTARKLAEIKKVSLDEVARITTANAKELFNI